MIVQCNICKRTEKSVLFILKGGEILKPKSLRKWVEIYECKAQDKAEIPKGFRLFYLPSYGFCIMKPLIKERIMFIYQACGDGQFWRSFAELMCRELGLNVLGTICNRDIGLYLKAFGFEVLVEQDINGEKRYVCQDEIGRKVVATYRGKDKKGKPEYWVTQYLDEKATTSGYFEPTAITRFKI